VLIYQTKYLFLDEGGDNIFSDDTDDDGIDE
jgi:hypothetical protein